VAARSPPTAERSRSQPIDLLRTFYIAARTPVCLPAMTSGFLSRLNFHANRRVLRRAFSDRAVALGRAKVTLPGLQPDGSVLLPNQWSLRPVGRASRVGDFPVNLALHRAENTRPCCTAATVNTRCKS